MKTKSLRILFGFAFLLCFVLAATGNNAAADPHDGDQLVHLPFISTPAGPPTVELVSFATNFGGDTITGIVHAGDERLFVVERTGRIRVVQANGNLLQEPFLNISDKVATDNWEEGLLGLAFHPAYPSVPNFFVTYTEGKDIKVSRFNVKAGNPNLADEKSETILMIINKQGDKKRGDYRVHNAGDIHFGMDGYLYIAIGDGGPDPWDAGLKGDPDNRGQSKDELLANMLRIDVNEDGSGLAPDCGLEGYEVPPDNPFVAAAGDTCDEIWTTGLRNPYRFSFDRLTGDMFIGEVGEDQREEIHFQPAGSKGGENYGWACYEGTVPYHITDDPYLCPPNTQFTMPIHEYDQLENDCSVIGGYVYRGQQYPSLFGRYIFGDFCTGRIWLLNRSGQTWSSSFADASQLFISTFGEDINGELYVGERSKGGRPGIFKVTVVP